MKYNKDHTDYRNSNNIEIPSVTTVLTILNKPFLTKWANGLGFKRIKVDDVLVESSMKGTLVHEIIYSFLMDHYYIWVSNKLIGKEIVATHFNSFLNWLKTHTVNLEFMEKQLTSDTFGGTVDFYGMVDGKNTIMDFKTSKKVYSSMFLQLAAYCIMLEERGLPVEQVAIIIINANKYDEKFMTREQLQPYINCFKVLVQLFHNWYDLNESDGWGDILGK